MKLITGATLFLFTLSVQAKPVYLDCATTYKTDPPVKFSVAIDENSRKITHQFSNGMAFNADGFFTEAEVLYKDINCSSTCITQQYTINRVDLSVRSSIVVSSRNVSEAEPITSNGQCKLQTVSARQF